MKRTERFRVREKGLMKRNSRRWERMHARNLEIEAEGLNILQEGLKEGGR